MGFIVAAVHPSEEARTGGGAMEPKKGLYWLARTRYTQCSVGHRWGLSMLATVSWLRDLTVSRSGMRLQVQERYQLMLRCWPIMWLKTALNHHRVQLVQESSGLSHELPTQKVFLSPTSVAGGAEWEILPFISVWFPPPLKNPPDKPEQWSVLWQKDKLGVQPYPMEGSQERLIQAYYIFWAVISSEPDQSHLSSLKGESSCG